MTNEEIDAARSKKGGWTRETLAKWGVPWPPPKGWRKALLKGKPIPQPDRPIGRTADFDSANVGSSPAPAARYVRNTELKVTTRVDSGIWHVHDGDDLLGEFPNSEAAWRFVDKREMARW